ncbi:ComEC/Rec2 family competence protein [Paracoccus sp. MBLB3053]|uniref:ComEC/Rec2 family competence protein n=1 Tax=Paracoccus aurantius TaxID=3073814 RepID=A0ABU2HT16_9RHOB|nr:ComEC/Rec2 family competence protein [Paracoccus sp. MBLB3053]MDS9468181.1 ComEC/Rec2 family competence protein [Paracoccus sp. MBLB3053]
MAVPVPAGSTRYPGRVRPAARAKGARSRPDRDSRVGLLCWTPFWLAIGIGGWFALEAEPRALFYILTFLTALSAFAAMAFAAVFAEKGHISWRRAEILRGAAFAIMLVAGGAGAAGFRSWQVSGPVLAFRYYGPVEGRVVDIDRSSRDRIRLTLDRVALDGVSPQKTPIRVRISLFVTDPLPESGAQVMLTAHLGPPGGPTEPGGFDFRRIAWFESLGAIGYSRTATMTVEPPRKGGTLALHRLRNRIAEAMRDKIGGQAGAVAAALMTGDRTGITEATNQIMRDANLYHIVSISGLHMSILAGFVYSALRLGGLGLAVMIGSGAIHVHKWAAAGALVAAAIYLVLSGGDVATERSFIMVAVMLVAVIADRRAISLRSIALAGAIILLLTPEALASAGFQMSFAATIALIVSHGPWMRIAPIVPLWLRPVAMLFISSLVASLATAPFAAAHFGRMTQYGLLANLLAVPIVGTAVMPAGVIAAVLAPIGLADLPLWVMGMGTRWMLWVAEIVAGLDGAVTRVPSPPGHVLPLIGVGACLVILAQNAANRNGYLLLVQRAIGAVFISCAIAAWIAVDRPMILISADGDAVGVMTLSGRSLSKPKGGAFAVAEWLEADGDIATQAAASQRPAWSGPSTARETRLMTPAGRVVLRHLTGKGAAQNLEAACQPGSVVVTTAALDRSQHKDCELFDLPRLRQTGSVAMVSTAQGLRVVTAREGSGRRAWSGQRHTDPERGSGAGRKQ